MQDYVVDGRIVGLSTEHMQDIINIAEEMEFDFSDDDLFAYNPELDDSVFFKFEMSLPYGDIVESAEQIKKINKTFENKLKELNPKVRLDIDWNGR